MVYVLCVALVELLVLDACLVMGGVERALILFAVILIVFVFYFPFRLGS